MQTILHNIFRAITTRTHFFRSAELQRELLFVFVD
jgi:hypothetical protein